MVDLDGTLVKSDLLVESFLLLLRLNFLYIFLVPCWLLRGKAYLKAQIASRVDLDVRNLPYHRPFLEFLREEAAAGRRIILATGADIRLAQRIAEHLGLFQQVLASDGRFNLTGKNKLKALTQVCREGFDYAGNDADDLPVCRLARQVILVNAARRLSRSMRRTVDLQVFDDRTRGIGPWLRAMRPHQGLKNLLLFVPLLTTVEWSRDGQVAAALTGFFGFTFCASAVYLLNDLFDLSADRLHAVKRNRPFAAGDLPLATGMLLILALLAAAFGLAFLLPLPFRVVLLVYLAATFAYTLVLKRVVIVDVLTLAGLYTLRVIAGAAAIDVAPSFWLLSFSMFIFLSLALVKRYAELRSLERGRRRVRGRDYRRADGTIIHSMGTASGFLSILVLALFIRSPELVSHYARPEVLWLLCPILLYWIGRIWIKAGRGEMNEDPILFTLRDRTSRLVLLLCVALVVAAQ